MSARLAILLAAAATVAAQTPPPSTTEPGVTAVWLTEVLDLDHAGAAASYHKLAQDAQQPARTRLLAAARLAELQRLGVGRTLQLAPTHELPAPARPLFASLTPIADLDRVTTAAIQAAELPPADLVATLRGSEPAIPTLRPLTPDVAQLRPESGDARTRQRPNQRRSTLVEWVNAWQILRFELDGDQTRANARRSLYFDQWRPPVWKPDVEEVRNIQARLRVFRQSREIGAREARALDELRDAIQRAADQSPQEVQTLLARLPVIADRLVGAGESQPR